MTVSRTICLGFLAVIVGSILLMMPFSTSSGTWNDPIVALFTSTSAVCVTGLGVVDTGTYFSFWGQFLLSPCSDWDWLYDGNHLSPAATGPNFATR